MTATKSWRAALVGAMVAGLMLGFASTAQAQTADTDGDGVPDVVDACPTTPPRDLIGPDGCSVCPCVAAWSSHDAYVACVSFEARRRNMMGTLSTRQKNDAIAAAKNSTCGVAPAATRCCSWKRAAAPGTSGSCSIKPAGSCTSGSAKIVQDRGPGTCAYDPCAF